MKILIKLTNIAFVTTLFLCLSACSSSRQTARERIQDEQEIRRIAMERIESFNNHVGPLSNSYTSDADFVNAYGMWRRGSAEIESRQKERMQTVLKDAKITLIDLRIRFLKPDVAIVHQLHELSGMLTDANEKMPPHRELGIRVMVKENGKWLTTAFHNTIVRE